MGLFWKFWEGLEGLGVAASISSWLKLKFLSRIFGEKIAPGPNQTGSTEEIRANPEGRGLEDEFLMWTALAHSVDMTQPIDKTVLKALLAFVKKIREGIGEGGVGVFYRIIGMKSSDNVERVFLDDEDGSQEQQNPPRSARRRNRKVREKIVTTNDRGARILLWIHETGPAKAFEIVNALGLLNNPKDQLTKNKKAFGEKIKKLQVLFGQGQVRSCEDLACVILGSEEAFTAFLSTREHLACLRKIYETTVEQKAKQAAEEQYINELYKELAQSALPKETTYQVDPRKKRGRSWKWVGIGWAIIIIAMLATVWL